MEHPSFALQIDHLRVLLVGGREVRVSREVDLRRDAECPRSDYYMSAPGTGLRQSAV